MKWPEAAVLGSVAIGASVAAIFGGFQPLPVFVGIIGWGASRTVTR